MKGFSQREGIAYEETFSPTTKMVIIKLVLTLDAHFGWAIYQMDVNGVFVDGQMEEEVYMHQAQGFQVLGKEHMVCILVKAPYDPKQIQRGWYIKINKHLLNNRFRKRFVIPISTSKVKV